ncbi:MAG: hypothetical protein JWN86_3068 [Planctomycetota bacterium]|nr:hypothetical protein [Planctomycetota bacterium]
MAALKPRIADLSDGDREVLESYLIHFDQDWEEGRLANEWSRIPAGSSWRLPALAEMVKIDLERQWGLGREMSLESYLAQFPELGTPHEVSADLILAEYEIRRQVGDPVSLEDYLRRFPNQARELGGMIANGQSSLPHRSSRQSLSANAPAKPSDATAPPRQFGRYTILKRLGQGGMGAVYLAEDTQLGRRVALKIPHFSPTDGPEARERFFREARTAATLDHPYLCPVYDVGEVDGRLYLTMQYIEGKSLAASLRGEGMPPRQVAALVGKLALAIQEAHAKGVVHRDLKPANIMIKTSGTRREPMIVDFGLARREDPNDIRMTKSGQVLGTLAYMAPEQLRGVLEEIGPGCDIYALGVILYELLTGLLPFSGPAYSVAWMVLSQEPASPRTHRADLDPRLEAICLKAMAKTVADRFATMGELATALTDYLKSPAPTLPGPVASDSPPLATIPDPNRANDPPMSGGQELVQQFFRGLPQESEVTTLRDLPRRKPLTRSRAGVPARRGSGRPWWFWPSTIVGAACFGLVLLWALGVVKVKTRDGVIVLENVPDHSEVFVDGAAVSVKWPGGGAPLEISVPPGRRGIEVKRDGFKTFGQEVSIETGGKREIKVRLEPLAETTTATAPGGTFTPLFNGTDLTGWKDDLTNGSEWVAKNGMLVGTGVEKNLPAVLHTERDDFADFRLRLRILGREGPAWVIIRRSNTPGVANGCIVAALPVTSETKPMVVGSIFRKANDREDGKLELKSVARPRNVPEGEWYTLEIHAIGNRITTYVNDEKVGEFLDDSGAKSGAIAIRTHGAQPIRCKEIAIAEVPDPAGRPTGFVPLFNGRDLSGWDDKLFNGSQWKVEDGAVAGMGTADNGLAWLSTVRNDFADFRLRVRVFNGGSTGGVAIRRSLRKDNATSGYAIRLCGRDETVPAGSISKAVDVPFTQAPAWNRRADFVSIPAGAWYTVEIAAIGNRITTFVNGKKVAEFVDQEMWFKSGDITLDSQSAATVNYKDILIEEISLAK